MPDEVKTEEKVMSPSAFSKFELHVESDGNVLDIPINFGMTDEEAAQMRRNSGRNVPSIPRTRPSRNNGEPWGMTDEEAAQMNDNYGMPMGMTDEEAAQMRQMQRQQRRARRR